MFLVAWVEPSLLPRDSYRYLLGVLMMEFIIIHTSSVMMQIYVERESRWSRAASIVGLTAAFSILVYVMTQRFHAFWLLPSFWLLTLNRLIGLFSGQQKSVAGDFVFRSWLSAFMLYMLCLLAGWMIAVPALGVQPDAFPVDLPAFGWFSREPQRFLATGYAYFTMLALAELTDFAWMGLAARRFALFAQHGVKGLFRS